MMKTQWNGGMNKMKEAKEIKKKLFNKLKEYYPNKDFVVGVMSNVNNDEDRQTIINFIDDGKSVSVDNIILLSLHLSNKN